MLSSKVERKHSSTIVQRIIYWIDAACDHNARSPTSFIYVLEYRPTRGGRPLFSTRIQKLWRARTLLIDSKYSVRVIYLGVMSFHLYSADTVPTHFPIHPPIFT